jgi:phosphate starvation-inducible membrane PsiE
MTETSTCYSPLCRTKADGTVAKCPKCGGRMRTPRDVRRAGWLLVVLGLFLVVFMGVITFNMAPLLFYPGQQVAGGDTFTGTADQARMIFVLFVAVIVFGVGTTINGVVQVRTGQRNRALTVATLLLAVFLIGYALLTTSALKS